MNDLSLPLEVFLTYEGRCGSCVNRGQFAGYCKVKGRCVSIDETCLKYQGGRAE